MTASELVRRLKAIRHEIEMDRINEAVCRLDDLIDALIDPFSQPMSSESVRQEQREEQSGV